jgi:hypothetical protein
VVGRPASRLAALIAAVALVAGCGGDRDKPEAIRKAAPRVRAGDTAAPAAVGTAAPGAPVEAASTTIAGPARRTASKQTRAAVPDAPEAAPDSGRGVTATEVLIGIELSADNSATLTAIGAEKDDQADQGSDARAQSEAVLKYVNAHGGLGGRRAKAVYHTTDLNTNNWQAESQETCTAFTEDSQVFAVVAFGLLAPPVDCYARRNTPLVRNSGVYIHEQRLFEAHPGFLYTPGMPTAERSIRAYIDGLASQGYFANGRIGLVRFDSPTYARLSNEVLKPRLAAHGLRVEKEIAFNEPQTVAAFSDVAASSANGILQLRSSRIDRVIFLDEGGIIPFFFLPEAESQGYHPRYGFMSNQQMAGALQQQMPKAQLLNSRGVGWLPPQDVDFANDPGKTPGRALCLKIFADAGISIPAHQTQLEALRYCDAILFLGAALRGASAPSPAALQQGASSLGDSFSSALAFTTHFGPGGYGGPSVYRNVLFDDPCGCFRYTGPLRPIP